MLTALVPHAVAALLGLPAARADERYRPMARALMALLAVHVGHALSLLPRPNRAERIARIAAGLTVPPYVGVARASWAVEQVLTVAWYTLLAWTVWHVLKDKGPEAVRRSDPCAPPTSPRARRTALLRGAICLPPFFLASSALLFAIYPLVRGRAVELAASIVFGVSIAVQLMAANRYVLRWRRPTAAQGVAFVIVVGSIADAAGPWLFAHPARDWYAGEPVGVLIWAVVGGVELWATVKMRAR